MFHQLNPADQLVKYMLKLRPFQSLGNPNTGVMTTVWVCAI